MPFFSIIIPLYNKENYIENTLKSIFKQTFTDYEIIIVNDGSSDRSEEKVLQFKDDRIKYYSQENKGVSDARNFGIQKAISNYICLLDADDYWYPNLLKQFYQTILSNCNHLVFACAIEIEAAKRKYPAKYSITKNLNDKVLDYFESSSYNSIISSSSVVIHKTVFDAIGYFDTNIKTGEDTDFWIRIGLKYKLVFISKVLAVYKYDDKSLSRLERDFSKSLQYNKFKIEEKTNLKLKKFLDLNRYSDAVKCKIYDDKENFNRFYSEINFDNLPLNKKIILKFPSFFIKSAIQIQKVLSNLRIVNSTFK